MLFQVPTLKTQPKVFRANRNLQGWDCFQAPPASGLKPALLCVTPPALVPSGLVLLSSQLVLTKDDPRAGLGPGFCNGQIINIFGFVGHSLSGAACQLCSLKAAMGDTGIPSFIVLLYRALQILYFYKLKVCVNPVQAGLLAPFFQQVC